MQKSDLIQPRWVLLTGLMGFAFFGALAVIGLVSYLAPDSAASQMIARVVTNEKNEFWPIVVLAAFALLGAFLSAQCLIEKHVASEFSLTCRNFFGIGKTVVWSDLHSIRYFGYPKSYFRLEANSGTVIRVSAILLGLPEFARLLLQSAPRESIDSVTFDILQATAAGVPPPLKI